MDGERNEVEEVVQQRARPPENQPAAALALALRCPRCDSSNTKFCYYNNYSLSQPRYFCKACRRYWTQGGTLRTVPIGGGCRKAKRPRISSSSSSSSSAAAAAASLSANMGRSQNLVIPAPQPRPAPPFGGSFYAGGSFLSTLAAVQSLPGGGGNQGAGVMGGGGRFGANMALLHGVSFPSFKAPPPPQRATPFFPPRQSLVLPGRLNSWSRSVINSGPTSSSGAATSGLWSSSGGGDGNGDQTGSSYAPNQWPESNRGFNPSDE